MRLTELKVTDFDTDTEIEDSGQYADEWGGPYAVGWTGNYFEWYGEGDPDQGGRGRYKGKGDGGAIVAINIPEYQTAKEMADELDRKYEKGEFEDKFVYNKPGEDYGYTRYQGAWVVSMNELEDSDIDLYGDNAVDYSKQ